MPEDDNALQIAAQARDDERAQRLLAIAGVGPITAAALVAIANKHARIIWALLVKGEDFDVQRATPKVLAVAAA